jgi:lipoate---protein ligase
VEITEYNLPDAVLLEDNSSVYRCMVWEPAFLCIVLGQSNNLNESVHTGKAEEDGVAVYKRPSGGETVVLSPKTLVISILKRGDPLISPLSYFTMYNEKIILALKSLGVDNAKTDGISDICIDDKKILGSSIYRNKDLVLYHAVLNRAESPNTIARYLKHPLREPTYRQKRSHTDFITSLQAQGYDFHFKELKEKLSYFFI